MAILRPISVVTVGGIVQTQALEWSTSHSVDAGIAQASIVFPAPAPAGVVENAPVTIEAAVDDGHALVTVFNGRIRGPIDRGLTESDATVTVRCDGNLWRLALPVTFDMAWLGPITPKKVIKQMMVLRGVELGTSHVETFVHPITGVPVLLGGVPWFDEGRVICARGTSPFAFIDRIARLFGYRVFDRPDGRILVSRVCGKPPESAHTFTEGVDILNVRRSTDLHPLMNYWEAQGASGTDIVGQAVAVVSTPRRGLRTKFIPNPPKWTVGTVSDPLLVSAQLADTARVVKEIDQGGVEWRVTAEVIGLTEELLSLQPRKAITITAPTIGVTSLRMWLISVSHTWGSNGFWSEIEAWRPTGKPRRTKPAPPPPPPESPPPPP